MGLLGAVVYVDVVAWWVVWVVWQCVMVWYCWLCWRCCLVGCRAWVVGMFGVGRLVGVVGSGGRVLCTGCVGRVWWVVGVLRVGVVDIGGRMASVV